MKLEQYLEKYIKRYDKEDYLRYFDEKSYVGLQKEDFSFSYCNKKLNGGYFFYPNYKENELVIFVNGIGSGYVSYMSEIERIARAGYKVLCVDNLGAFSSEGENIRALSEALAILDNLLNYLSTFSWYKNTKIKLVGHSLGGYAVSNILNYHPEVNALVVLSGFVSVKQLLQSMDKEYEEIYEYEKRMNPKYVDSSSLTAIKGKSQPILFIHSKDDNIVSYRDNFQYLKDRIEQENVKFITVEGKGHNPDYTKDGVEYMHKEFSKLFSLNEKERIEYSNNIDFGRIVKIDEEVFSKIIELLEKTK